MENTRPPEPNSIGNGATAGPAPGADRSTRAHPPARPDSSATARGPIHAFTAGLVLALLITLGSFSYSQLIFAPPLNAFAPLGFASAMISAVVIGLVVARRSSLAGIVAIPQDRIAPIYALIVTQIAARLPAGTEPSVTVALALAAICATTLLTGLILLLLGRLRLGNLLRFVPYPVVGGFLAASGWLLLRGGFKLLTSGATGSSMLDWFVQAPSLLNWVPGALFALALAFLIRNRPRPLIAPVALLAVLAAFYGVVLAAGISTEELRGLHFLPGDLSAPWEVEFELTAFTVAPWHLLAEQSGLIATVLVTTFVSIVLSSSAVELLTNQEADLNHELRVTGWGNLAAGSLGGMVGFHSLSLSRFSIGLGIPGRRAPTIAALACVGLFLAAPWFLPYVPNLIPGALLLLLGLLLLLEWLVDGWRKLSRTDFFVVVLILVTVAFAGYLEGVAVGTIAAVVLFIIKYSQVSVVTTLADGRQLRSNVERPPWHLTVLDREGERTLVLRLRGFIFFGTATELLNVIRTRIGQTDKPPLHFVVLDFQRVTGFDSSAALTLTRVRALSERTEFRIVFSGIGRRVARELEAAGFAREDDALPGFPDLDHALEWCEDHLVDKVLKETGVPDQSLRSQLLHSWPDPETVDRLLGRLERFEFDRDEVLIRQGEASDSILFIEAGHVTARVEQAGGRAVRLRRQGGGTVVGELGLYLNIPRTASVVADTAGVAFRLSRENLDRISTEDPALATAFHRFIVHILAARNAFINTSYRTSLD